MYIPRQYVDDFFGLLNDHSINYALIKNIGDELPLNLSDGKDIDILVSSESKQQFENAMLEHGYHTHIHPFGTANGWYFGYELPEHQFWRKEDNQYNFYIDASFALCCKSLIPKVWIPLDRKINESVWENKTFNEQNCFWQMDERNLLIYLLVRCIFDKQYFSDVYIPEIEKRENLLADSYVREALRLVFFKFTPKLVDLIINKKFTSIIKEYISFMEY